MAQSELGIDYEITIFKFFGYSSFFWFAFSLSLYLTFPMQALKGKIVTAMEEGLGKGKQGRYGTDPVVEFKSWAFGGFQVFHSSVCRCSLGVVIRTQVLRLILTS